MRLRRIDSELVRRGLARSRTQAQELIAAGRVALDGETVLKPARQMDPAQAIVITEGDGEDYASRGAHKLAGALDALGDRAPVIEGRRCLDAGASTGGFTDVLLRRGASSVVAVDVGYGQLAWRIQADPRVEVHDRTNVRTLDPAAVAPAPQVVVGDLSFISLTLVIPALVAAAAPDADFLLMVKPQFEIGKDRLGHGGVVRDPAHHVETVLAVAQCAMDCGLGVAAVEASPLPGPSGNIEYFLHMRADHPRALAREDLAGAVADAVSRGPAGASK
ncbi:TlyA family RNA methyltransferase [Actinomyces sp. B33]|uniref:TlyA family RNA methyltransferase n=1 Tax=Actinomyces sp. B33 TaxID=2942131 RepID=UPI00234244AF|nr:TlyA family RNA methyltransferase [Actinomyces sp. B33]MDC4233396.1 TlyA family RNA methyltransferase [Actinomyces sp. B33]